MRYFCLYFFLFNLCCFSYGQKEDYHWLMGGNVHPEPGIQVIHINWNYTPYLIEKVESKRGVSDNNTSISDQEGNLLFWTNGCSVLNRESRVMPNGDTMNWDPEERKYDLDNCLRGYNYAQATAIIPDPAYDFGYYIFHKSKYDDPRVGSDLDLRMTYVDMTLDEGLGDVVFFDSVLYNEKHLVSRGLELVRHINNQDWWLYQPIEDDSFMLVYLINGSGVHRMPDQYAGLEFTRLRSGAGTMRLSPDGRKLAYFDYFLNVHVYDIDRSTGQLTNHTKVHVFDSENLPNDKYKFGSVEWSSNSRFLYVCARDSLLQIDMSEENLQDGVLLIDIWDGTAEPFSNNFYLMQLAPDCKIYLCSNNGEQSFHVIHDPNKLGSGCNFIQSSLKFPPWVHFGPLGLPLFPRFRVNEAEKCDPTLSSVFGREVWYRRDLVLRPNPCADYTVIDLPRDLGAGSLIVYDMTGRLVTEKAIFGDTGALKIDTQAWPAGTYQVELWPDYSPERIFYGTQLIKQ